MVPNRRGREPGRYGIDVTPAMLRRPEYAAALRLQDADWHAVAVTVRARKG